MRTLLLALLATGCVTKGKYEVSRVQLVATRAALAAREADARKAEDDALRREVELRARITGLESLAALQQSHQSELEAAIAQLSGELAEHALLDQAECPELPAGTEPTPACAARAAHIDATLAEVTDALAARSRQKLRASERAHEHQRVLEAFESLVDDELAFVDVHPEGSVVRILVAKLYNENTTTLSPLGISIVERVASALDGLRDHHLDVIGHTDDVSVSSVTLPSNWELGFAYAVGVVRLLEDLGATLDTHASSRAGNDPLLPPVDAEARRMNRRVELVLTPLEIELPVTETPHGPHPLTPPDDPTPEAPEAPEVAP